MTTAPNPFAFETHLPLVAIRGPRCGYLQLALSIPAEHYADLNPALFEAARAWAAILESHEAPRVYWITLSEVVRQLHIHLYPRWEGDNLKGIALFEARETTPQPAWTPPIESALAEWASRYGVYQV